MVTAEECAQFFVDIMRAAAECIPIEIHEAARESRRTNPCEGMTNEERANWIMGNQTEQV